MANILIAFVLSWILFLSVFYLLFSLLGLPGLYFLGILIYLPVKFVLFIAEFFSYGPRIDVTDPYRTMIALIVLGYFIVDIFVMEARRLTSKGQKEILHQRGYPRKE